MPVRNHMTCLRYTYSYFNLVYQGLLTVFYFLRCQIPEVQRLIRYILGFCKMFSPVEETDL